MNTRKYPKAKPGDVFGHLTVIADHPTDAHHGFRRLLLTRCTCGKEGVRYESNLNRPNAATLSCGCGQRRSAGKRWGLALRLDGRSPEDPEVQALLARTQKGRNRVHAGDVFSWYTVLLHWTPDKHGRRRVMARCVCGCTRVVAVHNLKQKTTRSCGCLRVHKARLTAQQNVAVARVRAQVRAMVINPFRVESRI